MKQIALFCATLCAVLSPIFAQTPIETELKNLAARRDKERNAALERIDSDYHTSLDSLINRTILSGDTAGTYAVAEALKAAGFAPKIPNPRMSPILVEQQITGLLTTADWLHHDKFRYKFTNNGRMRIIGYNRSGKYTIDGKTGFVAFFWDGKEFPGEGLQFDQASQTFSHNKGGEWVRVTD
jgi:hypothetical protein